MNKHAVSRRWFTEANVKHFKSGALRTITNITRNMVNWKKEFLHRFFSKILFIDTEQFSKMQVFLQLFFKDFIDRFGTTYLKNGFLWNWFSKKFLIDFRIVTNLKTYPPKSIFKRFLFVNSKPSKAKIIHLKKH